jgi:serralysin
LTPSARQVNRDADTQRDDGQAAATSKESGMQPGKHSRPHPDQDFFSASDFAAASRPSGPNWADDATHEATMAAAKGVRDKPARIDRGSDFLAGAADGADPTPDHDVALDTLAAFLTDGYYDYYEEERRTFDLGADGAISVKISGLSKAGQKLALHALDVWTVATGIKFTVVRNNAEIVIDDDYASAYTNTEIDGNRITSAFINIADEWLVNNGSGIHDYSMLTFIHEMGHALGLGHGGIYGGYPPPVDPPDPLPNDSWQATIMSYNSQDEVDTVDADRALPVTPMMADLLAIDDLYDLADLRTGNNVYSFKADFLAGTARTIVDDGGRDRLDLSWSKKANLIDLHEETFSSIDGIKGNLAMARGTVIEAAVGGIKGDTIIGNGYANALYGNLGKDMLTGNDGEDFFVFDTKPSAANADTITDFVSGGDHLVFNNAIFTRIGADGALKNGAFTANTTGEAGDRGDRVVHNTVTGEVFYDADGSRSGAAKLVAVIGTGLDLGAPDVLVI